MECAICYEKFLIPKSKEEFEKICNQNVKNNDYNEIQKLKKLLITPNHNETHTCSTPNCECIICSDCWSRITLKGKNIWEATEDDIPSIYDKFKCPYCRSIDWKYYMENVFDELQEKVLGREEFYKLKFNKCFPEFNK
jgi:DNA-directed RNA polymerase subunit RPC12/RpoP